MTSGHGINRYKRKRKKKEVLWYNNNTPKALKHSKFKLFHLLLLLLLPLLSSPAFTLPDSPHEECHKHLMT
jgi:hypothetical protein